VQGFEAGVVLPVARQLPAGQAVHEEDDMNKGPPALKVPAGQGFTVPGAPVPAGQKNPAGQPAVDTASKPREALLATLMEQIGEHETKGEI